ncbi:endonuclease Q family protein [Tepidibacillus sp. LV47]|uniref:endonuclease Q family protein n=1 Tax=Tepidibacillus sp. LV47 TaxID=3398228 RepID=UPI003AAF7A65
MKSYFADLHIHIGWTETKKPVKISASKNLTFRNIIQEAYHRKGLDMIGIIDAHSPLVQREIQSLLQEGMIQELAEGGLRYQDLTILLGSEIEIKEENRGEAHYLVFLPYFEDMVLFSDWMKKRMKNIQLSSQRLYVSTRELQKETKIREGLFIPAHIFTPFKSVYGNCCKRMEEVLDLSLIDAVELGLSSDTEMADQIVELHPFTFVTNSDAHSLAKIGREYNQIQMETPSFKELTLALRRIDGRRVISNYGLDPKLGKYYKSRCAKCETLVIDESVCPKCDSQQMIKGVSNRIREIATLAHPKHPEHRPPYIHQVPLEFIPKLGPKTLDRLLEHFGTEMNIIHRVKKEDLLTVVFEPIADMIIKARTGQLKVEMGGGGLYGKVLN